MMQISHAATGAAVGKFAPNPLIAFLLGILIHFLIDKIPHWWPASKKQQFVIIIVDYVVTAMVIGLFFYFKTPTQNMIWGMAGSLVVDPILVGIPVVYKSKIGQWHTNRQPHIQNPWSFATDLVAIALSCGVIFIK